ncbi:luciferase family protein [Terrimonas rubra]|uniref:Luciferase family protein n=1 Tax=Terrimonas rubra TaxID=1035890 RepID=A0ABW6A1H7_9BACT
MENSKIITEIENTVLKWEETSTGNGDFGAITFLYRGKEFGHIHKTGDLDISFGEQMTEELLKKKLVKKHLYVPKTNITYPVLNEEKLPFAISLLRISYLSHYIKANEKDMFSQGIFESELAKLPERLTSVYLKQK